MLRYGRAITHAAPWRKDSLCCFCAARSHLTAQQRSFSATERLSKNATGKTKKRFANLKLDYDGETSSPEGAPEGDPKSLSLKEALLGAGSTTSTSKSKSKNKNKAPHLDFEIKHAAPEDFTFEAVDIPTPPLPMLAYGLDRVLFNPGVYRLQDPRTGIYNFDPYLEKIMPVEEFDFDALIGYQTSSKDQTLLATTRKLGAKYTGSTSSMSSALKHFHFLLSAYRKVDHSMLSKGFPETNSQFSRITTGPDAVFLRYKDGVYAIDADKTFDTPNIMSWLGHSMEKLLTTDRTEFERYRKSNPEESPKDGDSSRCFHYSKQGKFLMRSQLDAHDPRLPGAGIFDLKTRAVVSIRMNHEQYQEGMGYQLRYSKGEWESFEREFHDMTRATLLRYSLQARMGRMDGIFIAYHNIERIFGFQYVSLSEMDQILHGQPDTCLGDQEFKLSVGLMEELLDRATEKFPETSIRLHFETRDIKQPFMYVFAEPVTEERADELQNTGVQYARDWSRRVLGVGRDDLEAKEAWHELQQEVNEQLNEDSAHEKTLESASSSQETETCTESESATKNKDAEETKKDAAIAPPSHTEDTTSGGPLMGWTLTIRNKVNGHYLARPEQLEPEDNWEIEYSLQEIPQDQVWEIYNAVKERRRQLVGLNDDERSQGLSSYRKLIQRYSSRGRKWRAQQDQLDEQRGVRTFEPLGPGSPWYAKKAASEAAASEAVAKNDE